MWLSMFVKMNDRCFLMVGTKRKLGQKISGGRRQ